MRSNKLTALPLILILLTTCRIDNKKNENAIINKWNGKEIYFPSKVVFTSLLTDTITFDYSRFKMKVLTYADTTDCIGCKLQLNKWKEFMTTVNNSTIDTIPFLFFIYPKDMEELKYLIQADSFSYPICIDTTDQLNRLNHFSSDISFLLDKNNHVIAVGNPTLNLDIRDFYLEKITGIKHSIKSIKTTAEINQSEIHLGRLRKSEAKEVSIEIRNTGNAPLVILDINTSCGCIKTSFDKRPISPGNKTQVKLKIMPTETGFFRKNLRIRANIDEIIILNIQGNITK